ncbi:pirin family protein [Nocardioides gilvus]|uniref:pirin family protein n=1 Tax=Nocardioides gilvus TaxID=1735589 RepID=UPI000D740DDA|nr:pirin family protein [Nocardioides gilvus]
MQIRLHQGSTRYSTRSASQVAHHSFSFGDHYDPENLAFGPMRAHNEHRLSWGAGFPEHRHSDVELVTWVMHGQVVHTDSLGNRSLLPAGTVQVQSAGSGISHSEFADTSAAPTRFVQTWLVPDELGGPPARFLASGMQSERMIPVAGDGAQVPVGCSGATLFVGSLASGTVHDLPVCSSHHLFVASGEVVWSSPGHDDLTLTEGDALRITAADDAEMQLRVVAAAEVMQWVFRTPTPG